ncbi:MAG: hypothetical protein IJX78_00190 [Bacilli bacterium]|nr:hypothetical protein [Bacilli bacterium]
MKRKLIMIFTLLVMIFSGKINVLASGDEITIETTKVLGMDDSYEIKETKEGILLYKTQEIKYFYQNNLILDLKEEYFCSYSEGEWLYLISKNAEKIMLRKINKATKKAKEVEIMISFVSDILIVGNEIIIVGEIRKDALICKYSLELEYIHSYTYGGAGYETFNNIYEYNGDYYLVGTKDAHSLNSPFENVGSINEKKVFMTKINKQGIIVDTIYFNHLEDTEDVLDFEINKGHFLLRIGTNNVYYIYLINSDLEVISYYEEEVNDSLICLSNTLDIIKIKDNLLIYRQNNTFDLGIDSKIKKIIIDDNILKLYYFDEHYLCEALVYQYKIDKQEDIIINTYQNNFHEKMNMLEVKELKVSSFIHDLTLELNKIEPFFDKQIHGTYIGHFNLKINENKQFSLNNKIIIEEYVNVTNGHIYPVGYPLKFFGYAFLDDKMVASGTLLKAGEHTLVLKDNLGKETKISFKVVEDYYNKEEDLPLTDYVISKNQEVNIEIKSDEVIKEVLINGQVYPVVNKEEKQVVVLNGFENYGNYVFQINKVITETKEESHYKTFTVKVLKEAPSITFTEEESDNFKLSMNIYDPDKSLIDMSFLVYLDEELVEVYDSNLKNLDINLGNISLDKVYKIKGILTYDLGNKEIKQVEFLNLEALLDLKEWDLLKVEMDDLANISLNIYTNHEDITINKLMVKDLDLKDKYQVVVDYSPLYISIGLSVIVLIIGGGYYFYKKKKANR